MTPEALAALHARAFTAQRPWSTVEFADLLRSPHVILCSQPNAFLLGRIVADEAEVLTLATDPDHRRHGKARACLDAFATAAKAGGASRAFLEVAADNDAAIALYRQAGYDLTATRRGYYARPDGNHIDAQVMTLRLV